MPQRARSATLSDVAREAGVSLATASRTLNGAPGRSVRPELAERVRAAADLLNYAPDAGAQAMARGRTTNLGLIVHDIADPYFAAIAAAVIAAADEAGYTVTVATTQNEPAREAALVAEMRRQRVHALVVAGGRSSESAAEFARAVRAFRSHGGRVVAIGQRVAGAQDVPVIAVDNAGGARELGAALLARGYRRIGLLTGPSDRVTATQRRGGLVAALAAAGLTPEFETEVEFTWAGGYDGMARLVASGAWRRLDAVVAATDVTALGALAAAREAGVAVPGDLALAGFGDIPTLRDVQPALTTVSVPMTELGRLAAAVALGQAPPSEPLGCRVVLRASTPPRQ